MLQFLTIQNFTIINQLDLEFKAGLTVLTGETGAGKSILIDALLLALGDRADSKVILHGKDRCLISVDFNISQLPNAQQWLNEHDLGTDQECQLRRVINNDGRSRGFINGQPVPLQLLRELGHLLIDIHGQHEHQTLLKAEQQRSLLDAYAGHKILVKNVRDAYHTWLKAKEHLRTLKAQSEQREARLELLNYQLKELNQLALQENELSKLDKEHKQLANAEQLLNNVQTTLAFLKEQEGSALQLLNKAHQLLISKNELEPKFVNSSDLINNAMIQIEEAVTDLQHYFDQLEANPAQLNEIEQRLSAIYDAARKHKVTPQNLYNLHVELQNEFEKLQDHDTYSQQLEIDIANLASTYQQAATALSESRQQTALQLAPAIEKYIHELGMPGGRFNIQFIPNNLGEFASHGLEQIEFYVSANPGQPLQPLAKVASGGELSRISLAIQVLTAQKGSAATLIFDEVDSGIGGGTAEIVGRLLKKLAESAQAICVTHLPQVAALAHHHYQVDKTVKNETTETAIRILDKNAKVKEIARMLGGIKITEQSLAHAREMIG